MLNNISSSQQAKPLDESKIQNSATANQDRLNDLLSISNITTRGLFILRGLISYLQQAQFPYSLEKIENCLLRHHIASDKLLEIFQIKFDPKSFQTAEHNLALCHALSQQINQYIQQNVNIDEAKILQQLLATIGAVTRTNAYQMSQDNVHKPYICFKFDSSKVPGLELPLPYAEIFVYASEFEGCHLRSAKVARGGLRWSDRRVDFRVEALALMKAQTTKNSVIVPMGSKGAFFIKNLENFSLEEDKNKYVVNCYKNFLRGLLDVTDNIIDGKLVSPLQVIVYDQDDPYLVVAADKGTASFSDYANAVAGEYNFWLGDAFASGGSAGYDHKKMAITAKGAWVCALEHLSNLGIPLNEARFLGIGDMSGDVFGNGMLLSDEIKLIAAFDHRHIFIDPNPENAQASFNERKRLFQMPRSKWSDYNQELISKGGGVFDRTCKSIALSSEIKALLQTNSAELAPEELIKALLTMQIDVIWNGGIGTYVKASFQSNHEIGDKTNDVLRVDGKDLKAKIIAEGGNLGFSQSGRIEFAQYGGSINTDFIDNSAGVDCSDHEVNIKICLAPSISSGKISLEQRNELLKQMQDQVASLVLGDNFAQTQAISIKQHSQIFSAQIFGELIEWLEQDGLLNRKLEFLPSKEEIQKRIANNLSLTRPELAVLLSYSKMFVYNKLLEENIASDRYFNKLLVEYFPDLMMPKFTDEVMGHQLSKEIIATSAANIIVNKLSGPVFMNLTKESGANTLALTKAFFIVSEIFNIQSIWSSIEAARVKSDIKIQAFSDIITLMRSSMAYLLAKYKHNQLDILALSAKYKPLSNLAEQTGQIPYQSRLDASLVQQKLYIAAGFSPELAKLLTQSALSGGEKLTS